MFPHPHQPPQFQVSPVPHPMQHQQAHPMQHPLPHHAQPQAYQVIPGQGFTPIMIPQQTPNGIIMMQPQQQPQQPSQPQDDRRRSQTQPSPQQQPQQQAQGSPVGSPQGEEHGWDGMGWDAVSPRHVMLNATAGAMSVYVSVFCPCVRVLMC